MEKNRKIWLIKLSPEIPKLAGDGPPPPVASFDIRIISFLGGRKTLVHPGNFTIYVLYLIINDI